MCTGQAMHGLLGAWGIRAFSALSTGTARRLTRCPLVREDGCMGRGQATGGMDRRKKRAKLGEEAGYPGAVQAQSRRRRTARDAKNPAGAGLSCRRGVNGEKKGRPGRNPGAATPSEAGRCALAVAFVFGPGGQDCGGVHVGKLL